MGTIKFILNIISWGMALAYLGTLPEMTELFRYEAGKVHHSGLVSLGKISRDLEQSSKAHKLNEK